MIIVQVLNVVLTPETVVLKNPAIIHKWKNNHDFGFDIQNPNNWRKWLIANGYHKQRTTNEGHYIAYRVYGFGGRSSAINLFPGPFKNGVQRPVLPFGILNKRDREAVTRAM